MGQNQALGSTCRMARKPPVYTIGPDCDLGSPCVLCAELNKGGCRAALPLWAASVPDLGLGLHQASHGRPARSPSFFLAAVQESPAPAGRRMESSKALLGYAEVYTNTAWRRRAGCFCTRSLCLRAQGRERARLLEVIAMTRWRGELEGKKHFCGGKCSTPLHANESPPSFPYSYVLSDLQEPTQLGLSLP